MDESAGWFEGLRPGKVRFSVEEPYAVSSFYQDVIGLEQLSYSAEGATLGVGAKPLIELVESDRPPRRRDEAGLYHLGIRFPSRAALGAALQRIEALYRLEAATDHGPVVSLYVTDPDGNEIELYADRPKSAWPRDEAGVVMETEPLDVAELRAAGEPEPQAPLETRLGHVHLDVTDLEASRRFYRDGLGLGVTRTFGEMASFLADREYHHHLGLTTYRERTEPATGRGLESVTFLAPAEALERAREGFESLGLDPRSTDGGLTVMGPDGIELAVRPAD